MIYVLDQNFAQNPELEKIILAENSIILADDFLLEPFRSPSATYILEQNLKMFRKYPAHFYMAYGIRELIDKESSQRKPLLREQLINHDATEKFRKFIQSSDTALKEKAERLQSEGARRLQLAKEFTEKYIREMAGFTQQRMKAFEPLSSYREDYSKFIFDLAVAAHKMTFNSMKERTKTAEYPPIFMEDMSISFAFSFIYVWRVVNWAINDGFQAADTKMRGDVFDISYLAISSLTDGILTHDKWLHRCRDDLKSIFQRV